MPVPWLQIVQLVPSILDVSRDLMRKTQKTAVPATLPDDFDLRQSDTLDRLAALETNERRQAELVNKMAQQLATLTGALMSLHKQNRWLWIAFGVNVFLTLIAIGVAART